MKDMVWVRPHPTEKNLTSCSLIKHEKPLAQKTYWLSMDLEYEMFSRMTFEIFAHYKDFQGAFEYTFV